jgi:hypothetical protein
LIRMCQGFLQVVKGVGQVKSKCFKYLGEIFLEELRIKKTYLTQDAKNRCKTAFKTLRLCARSF